MAKGSSNTAYNSGGRALAKWCSVLPQPAQSLKLALEVPVAVKHPSHQPSGAVSEAGAVPSDAVKAGNQHCSSCHIRLPALRKESSEVQEHCVSCKLPLCAPCFVVGACAHGSSCLHCMQQWLLAQRASRTCAYCGARSCTAAASIACERCGRHACSTCSAMLLSTCQECGFSVCKDHREHCLCEGGSYSAIPDRRHWGMVAHGRLGSSAWECTRGCTAWDAGGYIAWEGDREDDLVGYSDDDGGYSSDGST
jgi:hypothetical protein